VRREARDGFILEEDLAAGRMKNSGQKVKEGGFPGSVGSDDTENFPLVDMEFQLMDGSQSTEEFTQVPDLQKLAHLYFF
jgi:hypothetical protein